MLFCRAISVAVCKSNVLFPIPGSPPIRTRDPGTNHPPRTLSNSLKPLVNLDILSDEISLNSLDFLFFLIFEDLDIWLFLSSTIVFHSLQLRHLPKYWEVSDPQFWQIKVENLLDIKVLNRMTDLYILDIAPLQVRLG